MMWRRLIHIITGRPVVLVEDFDGELAPRLVHRVGATYFIRFYGRLLTLDGDGTLKGSLVKRTWTPLLGDWRSA